MAAHSFQCSFSPPVYAKSFHVICGANGNNPCERHFQRRQEAANQNRMRCNSTYNDITLGIKTITENKLNKNIWYESLSRSQSLCQLFLRLLFLYWGLEEKSILGPRDLFSYLFILFFSLLQHRKEPLKKISPVSSFFTTSMRRILKHQAQTTCNSHLLLLSDRTLLLIMGFFVQALSFLWRLHIKLH